MIRVITMVLVLCFVLQLSNGESLSSERNNTTALAYVDRVYPRMDNQWMVAVEDPSAASGWAVKVKKFVTEDESYDYFAVNMRARSLPDGTSDFFYDSYMCGLFDADVLTDVLPRQIIDMIFPGRQGSCNFTEGTRAIKRSAYVTVDPEEDIHVNFPKSMPMEVVVDIVSEQAGNRGSFFQVYLVIGGDLPKTTIAPETTSAPTTTTAPETTTTAPETMTVAPETTSAPTTTTAPETTTVAPETTTTAPETTTVAPETTTVVPETTVAPTTTIAPETTTTSQPIATDTPETSTEPVTTSAPEQSEKSQHDYYCLNAQWNYYIVWRICTIVEFIESSIFEVGRRVVHIF